jgi:hypothetical protein
LTQTAGSLAQPQQVADEAMQLYRGLDDDEGVGRVLWSLSSSYYFHGDIAGGLAFAQRALDVFEGSADVFMTAWAHYLVGTLVMTLDRAKAREHLVTAYRLFTEANDTSGHVLVFDALATLAWREGDVPTALRLTGFVGQVESTSGTGLAKLTRDRAGFFPKDLTQDPALAASYQEGRRLTMAEATRLALRGER